jgi:hypothetical protein
MERLVDLVLFPISLFSGKTLAVTIALLVLGAALGIWLFIRFAYERPFLAIYGRLASSIANARKGDRSQEQVLARVGNAFAKSPLADGWEQYKASLEFSDGQVFNYTDPAPYFDGDRLEGHSYTKWSSTLGGVFLTVGLFFTFVGLSAALLQVAGDGHDGALSPDKLRTAVGNILGISSVKFITSLAGILAYIGWSLAARFQIDAQERAVGRLIAEIRRLSTYVSPEKLLLKQLETQRAQHEQFQTFGTDLAVAIGRQIESALKTRFDELPKAVATSVGTKVSEAMTPVQNELIAIARQIGDAGGQIATGAGDVFSNVWKTSMESPIAAFGEQMKSIVGALQGLPNTVRQLEAGLGGEIGGATKDLTQAVAAIGNTFRTQQEAMMGAVTGFNARVAEIPDMVATASQNSAAVVGKAVEDSLSRISEITAKAGQASAEQLSSEVAKIAASLSASAEALKLASDASSSNIRNAGAALDDGVRNSIKSVQEASLKSSEELSGRVSSLSEVVNVLCDRLSQSAVLLEAQQTRLNRAGEVVSSASNSLSNAAANVERAAAPLPSALGAVQSAAEMVATASGQLRDTSAAERQAADMLNASVGAARTAFDEQANRFRDLQDRVRETVGELVNGVTRLASEISTCIEAYDSAIAKSIGGLENAILEVADVVEKPKAPRPEAAE